MKKGVWHVLPVDTETSYIVMARVPTSSPQGYESLTHRRSFHRKL